MIEPVRGAEDLDAVRALFREYADGLGLDLGFQGFEAELAGLPGRYAPPAGTLLLARAPDGASLGCVGLRPLDTERCEVKRLYLRAAARGTGLGRVLALAAIEFAQEAGYREAVLDTLPSMQAAIALYRSLGFAPIPNYGNTSPTEMLCFGYRLS